jgi:alpha-tubulin suppressor-like RCC1 family protein
VAAGALHSLALTSDGAVWAWGGDTMAQLGNAETGQGRAVPQRVAGVPPGRAIAAGALHSLVLDTRGRVWAWGTNVDGEGGTGDRCADDNQVACFHLMPRPVAGLTQVRAIAGGGQHSLALRADGTVWAWGANSRGQLGSATACRPALDQGCLSATPVGVHGLPDVVAIAAGGEHSLALDAQGQVWAWGDNLEGQLGRGPAAGAGGAALPYSSRPLRVGGLGTVVAIAAGEDHSLALEAQGRVWAWGGNAQGQLGAERTAASSQPVVVDLPWPVVAIAAGRRSSAALTVRGTVWTWGWNAFGQLAAGTTVARRVPAPVRGLGDVVRLAQGSENMHWLVLVAPATRGLTPWQGSGRFPHVPAFAPGSPPIETQLSLP